VIRNLRPYVLTNFSSGWFYDTTGVIAPPASAVPPSVDLTFESGVVTKREGEELFLDQVLDGIILGMFDYVTLDGARHLLVLTTTTLYRYDVPTGSFVAMLRGLRGSATIRPFWTNFYGEMLIVNGVDPIIRVQKTGAGITASIIDNSPIAKTIASLSGRVLVGNIGGDSPQPAGVKWSAFLDPTNWTTLDSGSVVLGRSDDPVQAFVVWRSQILLLRRSSIWVVTPLDGAPFYAFDPLIEGLGTIGGGTASSSVIGPIFLADDNIYLVRGAVPEPAGRASKEFVRLLNIQISDGFQSVVNPSLGRYYVLVAQGGSSSLSNVLVYNYNDGFVTLWNKGGVTSVGVTLVSNPLPWSSATFAWSSVLGSWSELGAGRTRYVTLYGRLDGKVYKESEVRDTQCVFRTPLLDLESKDPKIVEAVELIGTETTAQLQVRLGRSLGKTDPIFTPFRTVTMSGGRALVWFAPLRGVYWCVEVVSSVPSENFGIREVRFWFRPGGGPVA
jgi:hypothetical protein